MIGLIVSLGTLFGAIVTAVGGYFRDRSQARKSNAEAVALAFRAGAESAEALARGTAGHVATSDLLLTRVSAQLMDANTKLDAANVEMAALRAQVESLTARLVGAGLLA